MRRSLFLAAVFAAAAATTAAGLPGLDQTPRLVTDDEWCREAGDSRRETHCEVREFTVARASALRITGNSNGSTRVTGGDRSDIRVRARVRTTSDTVDAAKQLAGEVRITIADGRVTTAGPSTSARNHWSVSYRADVPTATDLEIETSNGSINVADVRGNLQLESSNGSLQVTGASGNVRGRTSNGSVRVVLSGRSWSGEGLDIRTSNGSARVDIPEGYNARLVAGTSNGSLSTDVPITTQGRMRREIDTTLGSGGATITVRSSNGSVRIGRPDTGR